MPSAMRILQVILNKAHACGATLIQRQAGFSHDLPHHVSTYQCPGFTG